jgi:hypothetical protein
MYVYGMFDFMCHVKLYMGVIGSSALHLIVSCVFILIA